MREKQDGTALRLSSGQLHQLLQNLHTMSGLWVNLLNSNGRPIRTCDDHSQYCRMIRATPKGAQRCRECAQSAVQQACHRGGCTAFCCHAGLTGYLLPLCEGGEPIGYFVFGQFLNSVPRMQQWEKTAIGLDWYPEDLEELRQAFWELRQCSEHELPALVEVMQAMAEYVQLKGLIRPAEYTDLQRLELYLEAHYTEKLSLQRISDDLHIGVTKLCAMAKTLSGGCTMHQLIAKRRVEAAKKLLSSRNCPISDVAGSVGFPDYNYFTRIFKTYTGMTPREYRKNFEPVSQENSFRLETADGAERKC